MAKSQISIDVSELKEMLMQISATSQKAIRLVDRAITESAFVIDRDLKQTISKGTRSGRVYQRGRKTHRASAPGEAPKTDTGRLVSSIRSVTSLMQAEVGSLSNIAKYAGKLEEGSFDVAARPVFGPTLEKNEPVIIKKISSAIRMSGLAK